MAQPSSIEVQYQLDHINDNKSIEMVSSQVCGMVIAFVAVALRFWSRRVGRVPILSDDYMIVVALVFAFGEAISTLICVRLGGGKHAILMEHPLDHARDVFAVELLYNPAIATVKFSVLLFYRRIFPNQRFRTMLWCLGGFLLAYSFVQAITVIFHCVPVQAAWDPTVEGKCININAVFITMGVLNAITDFVTLFLPMPMLWKLQMPKARKVQVLLIFLLGGFVCIVSAYRVTKLDIQQAVSPASPPNKNISLTRKIDTDANAATWSTVEVCIAIVCACLPTLRPLFRRKIKPTTESSYHPKHTGDASIDVTKGYLVRSWQGTDLVRFGSSHQMLAPTTWTDIQGGTKGGGAFQVREVAK